MNLSWNLTRDVAVFRFYQCERDVCVTKTVRIHMYGAPWADLRFCYMSVKQFWGYFANGTKPFGRQSDLRFCYMSVKQFGAVLPTVPNLSVGNRSVPGSLSVGHRALRVGNRWCMGPQFGVAESITYTRPSLTQASAGWW